MKNSISLISKYRTMLLGLAALWIYIAHEYLYLFKDTSILSDIEIFIKTYGFCGVDIFLLLSGLGLVYSIEKRTILDFYIRRIKRVYIIYIVAAIIVHLLMNWTVKDFFLNISFINFYTKNVFSCLWYIPMIITLYIFFPLYYNYFKKSENKILFTAFAISIWLLIAMLSQNIIRANLYNFINRIPIFLFGILLGYLIKNKKITITKIGWKLLFVNLILGGYLIHLTTKKNMLLFVPVSNAFLPTFLMSISIVFLASKIFYHIENLKVQIPYKIISSILTFFGTICLEFFCVQEVYVRLKFLSIFYNHLGAFWGNIALFTSATLLSYLFHIIMKYFIKLLELCVKKIKNSIK